MVMALFFTVTQKVHPYLVTPDTREVTRMSDVLPAVFEFVSSHPWVVAMIPAIFVVIQLAVVRPWNARARRLHNDRAAQRFVRDLHIEAHRRATDPERRE